MKKTSWIQWITIVLIAVSMRLVLIADKNILKLDDSLSYLLAAGHLRQAYDLAIHELPPLHQWTHAGEWKDLLEPEGQKALQQIASDSATIDIHPPLYFWILHGWLRLFGVSTWSGPLLNILIDLLIAVILYRFTSQHFGNQRDAILVSALYLLSPISIHTASWIRQYSLLTFLGLIFAMLAYKIFLSNEKVRPGWRELLFVLTMIAGCLTHYYFIFFIGIGFAVLFIKTVETDREKRGILVFIVLFLLAAGFFYWIYPGFLTSIENYSPQQFDRYDITYRIKRTVWISGILFSPIAMAVALSLVNCRLTGKEKPKGYPEKEWLKTWTAGYTILLWLVVLLIYLTKISPYHAMGAKYVSFIVPFVAFTAFFALPALPARNPKIDAAMIMGMVLLGAISLLPTFVDLFNNRLDVKSLQNAETIVLDNPNPGIWPGVLVNIDGASEILISSQEYLIAHPQEWIPKFCQDDSIYVSFLQGENTSSANTEAITSLIRESCSIELVTETDRDVGMIKVYQNR